MKIAFVTHELSSSGGGITFAVQALSTALLELGVEVRVFGLSDYRWEKEGIDWKGAPTTALPTFGPQLVGFSPKLRKAIIDYNPDIIHTHGLWKLTSATVANLGRSGIPYIVSPHGMLDSWALNTSKTKKLIAEKTFERRHLIGASCFHALNKSEVNSLRNYALDGPIATIPNGVSLPASVGQFGTFKKMTNLDNEKKKLLFLGRLHPKKNVDGLLHGVARMIESGQFENWSLTVAGWGENGHDLELKQLAKTLQLDNKVSFSGPLLGHQKDAAYRNASAFVLPSFSEGLPMAVLEAWSYALPVAMTTACNLPLGFTMGAAQKIETDHTEMARSLGEFLSLDLEKLNSIGKKGNLLVKNHYSWPRIACQFMEVYYWLLKKRSPPYQVTI